MTIRTLDEQEMGDVFLGLFKGENGTGKSIGAVSWAVLGLTEVFDFEDRMRSVANYYRRIKRPEILKNVRYDTYISFHKLRKRIELLQSNPKGLKNIIFDSLTSFTDRALSDTKEKKGNTQETTGEKSGRTVGSFRVNTLDDFGAESAAIQEFIVENALIFKSMGINFICTAHVIKVKEENDQGTTHFARYLMSGGKKAGQKVPGYYDEIYHFNVEPGMGVNDPARYTIRTRHSGLDTAKTSLTLPPKIDFTDKLLYEEILPYIPKPVPKEVGQLIVPGPFTKESLSESNFDAFRIQE